MSSRTKPAEVTRYPVAGQTDRCRCKSDESRPTARGTVSCMKTSGFGRPIPHPWGRAALHSYDLFLGPVCSILLTLKAGLEASLHRIVRRPNLTFERRG